MVDLHARSRWRLKPLCACPVVVLFLCSYFFYYINIFIRSFILTSYAVLLIDYPEAHPPTSEPTHM